MKRLLIPCVVLMSFATVGCSERAGDNTIVVETGVATTEKRQVESGSTLMRGTFIYMADAAVFEDCADGRRSPVAMEADYLSAERAYLDARSEPGAPVLVTFEGRLEARPPMEGDGVVETIVIDRFHAAHPGDDCDGE